MTFFEVLRGSSIASLRPQGALDRTMKSAPMLKRREAHGGMERWSRGAQTEQGLAPGSGPEDRLRLDPTGGLDSSLNRGPLSCPTGG